jgi:cytoskeletal protein CcmA (bactofilin family)
MMSLHQAQVTQGFFMATNPDSSNNLIIGQGVVFKGSLAVPNKATVYGTVDGDLTADEIYVGTSGTITGVIKARSIEVEGGLHQSIECSEHLYIRSTGRVSGKLDYSQIQIDRGGEFEGEMKQSKSPGMPKLG